MAKGKITQYDVGSFSPSAVGVPGPDKSGQIIAAGVESLGKSIAVHSDTSDTLAAMSKFGDFDFNYQQRKLDLQKAYQNNPEEYPAAAKDMATKLSDEQSKGLSGGVFLKYKGYVSKAVMQDAEGNAKWGRFSSR